MKAYSVDLRQKIVDAYEQQEGVPAERYANAAGIS
jgi:hypothetical protein